MVQTVTCSAHNLKAPQIRGTRRWKAVEESPAKKSHTVLGGWIIYVYRIY